MSFIEKRQGNGRPCVRVSRRFVAALKLAPAPAYRIAISADVNPSTLSALIHGAKLVSPNDPRILRIAEILGVPRDEVFEKP